MTSNLQLKKFVTFGDLTINFSPSVNSIIGEIGASNAQLLKTALTQCDPDARADAAGEKPR